MSVEVMGGGGSANLQSKSILPASLPYTANPDSGYDGFSSFTMQKPSTLIASNIKSGVSIFGQAGNLKSPQYHGKSYSAAKSDSTRTALTLTSNVDTDIYPFSDEQTIYLVSFTIMRGDTSVDANGINFMGSYAGLGRLSASSPSITASKMVYCSGTSVGVLGSKVSIAFSGNNVTVSLIDTSDYFASGVPYAAIAYWVKMS